MSLFETRSDKRKALVKSGRPAAPDKDTMRKLGPSAAAKLNPRAKHKHFKPHVPKRCNIMWLRRAPTALDDERGVWQQTNEMLDLLGGRQVGMDAVCRIALPTGKKVPAHLDHYIECFRGEILKTLMVSKPRVLVVEGDDALRWALPGIGGGAKTARGRMFPIQMSGIRMWVCPVMDRVALGSSDSTNRIDKIPVREWISTWESDVKAAIRISEKGRPKRSLVHTEKRATQNVRCITTFKETMEFLDEVAHRPEEIHALDLETSHLRPYAKDSAILTCSIAMSEDEVVAFPIEHPEAGFSVSKVRRIYEALREYLSQGRLIAAHHLAFELEWLGHKLGPDVLRTTVWLDTMTQAATLDERSSGHGLDYLCRQHFGLALKSVTDVDRASLQHEQLAKVLLYNGMDSRYTWLLHEKQSLRLGKKLGDVYIESLRRIPTLVMAQLHGLHVDQKVVRRLQRKYQREIDACEKEAAALPDVQKFMRTKGDFNLRSTHDITKLLRDGLGYGDDDKPFKTDEASLKLIKHPISDIILRHRSASKQKGTYLDKFLIGSPDSLVWPDGRIHTIYNTTFARTGRLSSEGPNLQNEPKRKDSAVRSRIVADPGHVIIAGDYGQIEARIIAIMSQDRAFIKALWEHYDVHMHWAQDLASRWPKSAQKYDSMKAYRTAVKSFWVFAQFFGASFKTCAKNLDLPLDVAEAAADDFWQEFHGVKRWHQELERFYKRHGYVQCMTGRRRAGPLNFNMIINTPVQGTASDLMMNAMDRAGEEAHESGERWKNPIWTIHDEIAWMVPLEIEEEATSWIVDTMAGVPYDWLNVPISVEVERGTVWSDMTSVGTFEAAPHKRAVRV